MAEGPVPVPNLSLMNKEIMDTYGGVSDLPSWDQWWAADKTAFPNPPQVPGAEIPYNQDEPQLQDFVPNYAMNYAAVKYGFIPAQHYPDPSPISQSVPSDLPVSLGSSEDRRSSTSSHPEQRKRKRNTTERPAAQSSRRRSSKKQETKAAPEEIGETSKTSRKSQKTESALITPPPEEETDDYTHGVKERNRVQKRNRIASNKFRVKKREDAKKLISDEEDMERINRDLSSCVADLRLEVYKLKMRLLKHTDCDCSLIRNYIANEAHRISDLGQDQQPPLHH